tara:strand:+ start:498 stop:740 length:243 start_codon:yes stop_codon:yes gene_type:complete
MKQYTSSSFPCEVKERLSLGFDIQFIQVGKDQEHVVSSEIFGGKGIDTVRVGNVDGLGSEGFPQDTKASWRIMIEKVFTA